MHALHVLHLFLTSFLVANPQNIMLSASIFIKPGCPKCTASTTCFFNSWVIRILSPANNKPFTRSCPQFVEFEKSADPSLLFSVSVSFFQIKCHHLVFLSLVWPSRDPLFSVETSVRLEPKVSKFCIFLFFLHQSKGFGITVSLFIRPNFSCSLPMMVVVREILFRNQIFKNKFVQFVKEITNRINCFNCLCPITREILWLYIWNELFWS